MRSVYIVLGLCLVALFFSCNPQVEEESEIPVFAKQVNVFGIPIYATEKVKDGKLLHAAYVLAEYLDNDEDGVVDNELVLEAMIERNTSIVMTVDENEMRSVDRSTLPPGEKQGLWDLETIPGGAEQGIFDAALEEIIHPITDVGYAGAYPQVFGTSPGSVVAQIMDKARGGQFEEVPEKYPDDAWYTYYDETCRYDCQVTEYVYWALTSILGAQDFPGRLERIQEEWRYNTAEKVKAGDPEIYALLTDPQYKFPTVLPDGVYQAKVFTIEEYQAKQ